MKIVKYSLGQLQANCYLLVEDDKCLIIDPGDEASFILEELQRRRLKLIGMLATHGHFDHIMATGEIQLSVNVPLYLNKKDQFLTDRTKETAEHFLDFKQTILPIRNIKNLDIKNSLNLPAGRQELENFKLKIIHTPGHTPGSVCFYFKEENALFTGDTLFKGAVGRFDFSYCSKEDLKKSLEILFKFPKDVVVYPGHGEKTLIEKEKNLLLQL
ncbi:hypothetical protein COY13_03965 [Candidatus Roizmanbacteria bacterium CG_4_10_14_0_2_um_filter_36_35]|uniref:Metallo-beta-lactamase domain-containing protein n=4 Tax=Candidatus Roizmaniibacteriota TaxID=1752723 RepID=A0A2M7BX93_9BACT|nr:MAG: hypothetical protein COV86_02925 [Candidatus Roizmanbacteria bacterium CG11_big_fil_rev_8_21_14_0_20_35_14]PIV11164.1 MAG: hypothetical protein COS50_01645 [Candidatus Roizmanbacteria bacterium CG03_land_8_20_14_0_80_35_26]PIZ67123.1 MAG: hypothetical protein COY13_03965 [Candidatus Roizmanbacteria bacterium CG_4_10_14_0_2_um_filter_36_35]PJC33037.1 MAG: hypothetical protein CO049_01210 [Candidatus Roizmanbacteria bacterium CG_4_9_14_0_2_um_filter_36_12]PJC80535.1 MAG: hypothetical prot